MVEPRPDEDHADQGDQVLDVSVDREVIDRLDRYFVSWALEQLLYGRWDRLLDEVLELLVDRCGDVAWWY